MDFFLTTVPGIDSHLLRLLGAPFNVYSAWNGFSDERVVVTDHIMRSTTSDMQKPWNVVKALETEGNLILKARRSQTLQTQ
jgi:hypothetical protein